MDFFKIIAGIALALLLLFFGVSLETVASDGDRPCHKLLETEFKKIHLKELISAEHQFENLELLITDEKVDGVRIAIELRLQKDGESVRIGTAIGRHLNENDEYRLVVAGYRLSSVTHISVNHEYHGKGFGALLYLVLARKLHSKGYVLMKSYDTTPAADRIWDIFVSRGIAQAVAIDDKPGAFEEILFRPQFLEANQVWREIDELIHTQ